MNKKLYMVSLGCSKNLVDSEVMLGLLEKDGFAVTQEPADANLLLVNTCGFIGSAVQEAIDEILELSRYKTDDPAKKIVVTGCLVQRYGTELEKELPEVDIFIGTNSFHTIVDQLYGKKPPLPLAHSLDQVPFLMDSSIPRKVSTPPHRAYMKITEGCVNRCSYCLIPDIRGKLRSRTIMDLTAEARRLDAGGVKEVTLVAQDLLAYGLDLGKQTNLIVLLEKILAETDIPWIRLLYLHPARVNQELLSLMSIHPRLLSYLDIPLQHASRPVLKAMKRGGDARSYKAMINRARAVVPDLTLRTTFIVGFPGEGEAEFAELLDFIDTIRFDHLGAFTYSWQEENPGADLGDPVPEEEKQRRHQLVMETQQPYFKININLILKLN